MKIRISAPALRIVAPHISEDPSRPILWGVSVETSGVIVATDGRTLCAHQHGATVADSDSGSIAPVIVRFRRIREALARKVETVEVEVRDNRGKTDIVARLEDARGVLIGTTLVDIVDGPYPLWRGVVPAVDREPAAIAAVGIDPNLLARFGTFPSGKSGGAAHFRLTGQESAILVTHPHRTDIIGLCMPYKYVANTADAVDFAWAAK
jgi:hypothetical protein